MLKAYFNKATFVTFTYLISPKMKIFTTILILLALGLIVFNITMLDFDNLTSGDSIVGMIGIVASLCAVFILAIFRMSRLVEEKTKHHR